MKIVKHVASGDAVAGAAAMVAGGGTTTGTVATAVTYMAGIVSAPTLILAAGGAGAITLGVGLLVGDNTGASAAELNDVSIAGELHSFDI